MRTIFATVADCRAFNGSNVPPSQEALILNTGTGAQGRYIFLPSSSSPDNNAGQLVIVPTAGTGRWIRRDPVIDLVLPVTFATADAAQLCLVPAELTLVPAYAGVFLETSIAWSGGALSTIGLSFTNSTTARVRGSLSAGAAGGIGGTYVNFFQQAIGSAFTIAGTVQAMVFYPGTAILHDRITSAFTAGAGSWHVRLVNTFTSITPANSP